MLPYILVLVTYLGGYAAGPTIATQEYSSAGSCFSAKKQAMTMIDGLIQANLQTHRTLQKSTSAECIKK